MRAEVELSLPQVVIPVSKPSIGELELDYVTKAVKSTWIGPTGEFVERLREEFSTSIGVRHAIPVANGTVALHLALLSLDIGEGDEVIVPSFTYVAPVNAIRYCGATPVFAEIQVDTWCLDPKSVESLITERTKAILVVHLYGMPADMLALSAISKKYNVPLVEDAAEAMFAKFGTSWIGSIGAVSTFSLFGNKILSSGEGGIVCTNDSQIAAKIELFRGQGMDLQRRYWFPVVGYNYRMTNVAAAIFCAQFDRREELIESRWHVYRTYNQMLEKIENIDMQKDLEGRTRSPWLYPLLVRDNTGNIRDQVMNYLSKTGVETRPFFIPVHSMPPYQRIRLRTSLDITSKISDAGFNLPTYSDLTIGEMEKVSKSLVSFFGDAKG